MNVTDIFLNLKFQFTEHGREENMNINSRGVVGVQSQESDSHAGRYENPGRTTGVLGR